MASFFFPSSQAKAQLPVEVSAVDAVYEDQPEEQCTKLTESTELDVPPQQGPKHEHVQRIIAGVKQNFGKINVAPEFSEEDLVPVEMPDLPDTCGLEEDDDEASEEEDEEASEEEGMKKNGNAAEEGKELHSDRAEAKSTREVNKELDKKIAKLKHFLDHAKSKRFSTIRSVYPFIFLSFCLFSCVLHFF